jgi:FlaA1/EpsC-like NDP-sugar epimerase
VLCISMFAILSKLAPWCDRLIYIPLRFAPLRAVIKRIVFLSGARRRLCLMGLDLLILIASIYLALSLRFEASLDVTKLHHYMNAARWIIPLRLLCLYIAGVYRPLLRYSGIETVELALKGVLLGDVTLIVVNMTLGLHALPRSVQIISSLISLLAIASARLFLRRFIHRIDLLTFRYKQRTNPTPELLQTPSEYHTNVIIYGAGQAGLMLAEAIRRNHLHDIVAFVDDNPKLVGRQMVGINIYASTDLPALAQALDVKVILLAIPSAHPLQRQQILNRLSSLAIAVRTVPTLEEIIAQQVPISKTREVDIADLLGRQEVLPDPTLLKANVTRKSVLVTGAGGSIGSELCRQIAQQSPSQLILFEVSEFALYSIDLELKEKYPQLNCLAYLGSVTDADRLKDVMTQHSVETIYHAAAYKHVPLVEANPAQGVLNNAYGTLITAQTARECKVETFVLISTDKAVRPTNVMGATKRLSELILQAFAAQSRSHTRFVMVRFGNVLGSSGSVVPRFRKQIAERKPITITHPDITRYFMSIPEAARLVIQAGGMGQGGEVFLLDMGDPVRIYDLAVQMIELSGLQPGKDIEIQVVGLRPGEKLYEELLIDGKNTRSTQHPKIYAAKEDMIPWEQLQPMLQRLFAIAQDNQNHLVKPLLKQLVAGYQPQADRLPTPSLLTSLAATSKPITSV